MSSSTAGHGPDGDVVVALLGEEATVKRFFRETDHIRLQPENDDDGADPQQGGQGARCVVGLLRRV